MDDGATPIAQSLSAEGQRTEQDWAAEQKIMQEQHTRGEVLRMIYSGSHPVTADEALKDADKLVAYIKGDEGKAVN